MILAVNDLFENICGYTVLGAIILLILCACVWMLSMMVCPFLDTIQEIKNHPVFKRKNKDDEVLEAEVMDYDELKKFYTTYSHVMQQNLNNRLMNTQRKG